MIRGAVAAPFVIIVAYYSGFSGVFFVVYLGGGFFGCFLCLAGFSVFSWVAFAPEQPLDCY